MAKRRSGNKSEKWDLYELLQTYGKNAVLEGVKYINDMATELQNDAIANIDRMKIGENTEYYEREQTKNGKSYKVKRRYVSTGKLKRMTKARLINADKINKDTKAVTARVTNDALNKDGKPYGVFLEYGAHPKPFFYKSYYENRNKIKDNLASIISHAWAKQGVK